MLKIQEFISCFNSIEEANVYLKEKLSLSITDDYLHNYSKKSKVYIYNKGKHSDINNPLVREANGLILDESYTLLSKGLDHHYNARGIENLPEGFKLYRSNIEEMTAGMMIIIFHYMGVWSVAAKDSINDVDYTIDVKKTIGRSPDKCWTSAFNENKNYIYVFDFISKEYKTVWPSSALKLYLLTIIDKETGKELDPFVVDDISECLGFDRPRHREIVGRRSLSTFMSCNRIPTRGVILSKNGIRIKLSDSLYYSIKAAGEVEDRIEPIHIAKIFLSCKDNVDLVVVSKAFPKYADFLLLFDKTMEKVWQDLTVIWTSIQHLMNEPAEFARAVPPYPLSHLLFMYKNKQIKTFREGIKKLSPHRLINITKGKYEKEFEAINRYLKADYTYESKTLPY
ncbi:MAG: hypothetical protein E3J47_05905 [Candidatus Stahlbacteria bacterium]|nr:MAG: hypothetical protein E3J47_05905 [Candidatus Stahlbacteria bacterium]